MTTATAPPSDLELSRGDLAALMQESAGKGVEAATSKFMASIPEALKALGGKPKAEAHQVALKGIVDQLDTMIPGVPLPWGSVIFGAIPGIVLGEVIDGFVPPRTKEDTLNFLNPVVKVVAAVATYKPIEGMVGRNAALFYAGTLTIQVASLILPLDQWVSTIVGWFQGIGKKKEEEKEKEAVADFARIAAAARTARVAQTIGPDRYRSMLGG